jgi:hypothetical protein
MYEWTRRLHNYAGLLTFTALIVWGVTGIHAVFLPSPGNWVPEKVSESWEVLYEAPGNLDDKALSLAAFAASGIKMSSPPPQHRRDENNNLSFSVYTPSGRRDLTYLEAERKIRVEVRQNDLFGFLSSMHAGSSRRGPPGFSARVWGYYNEFANWSFGFMTLTGLYLWLATRPRLMWAWITCGIAVTVCAALWMMTR